jgi:hypothetical protein
VVVGGREPGAALVKVLDLFAGLRGWSKPWEERGHETRSLDFDPKFECTYTMSVLDFTPLDLEGWRPDVILASPPCEGFSVMNIGANWTPPLNARRRVADQPNQPKTDKARLALQLVEKTLSIIDELAPTFYVIENPRAKLRVFPTLLGSEHVTVTYCKYGETYCKPTDLWGGFPLVWQPRRPCRPDLSEQGVVVIDGIEWRLDLNTGEPCHHVARRGSRTGIQADLTPEDRAEVPAVLSESLCLAAEASFDA